MPDRREVLILALGLLAVALTHLAAYAFGWQAHARDEAERRATSRAALIELEAKYRKQGEQHAEVVRILNEDLDEAHAQLARLTTGRRCLDAPAVRVLNRTGRVPAPAARADETPTAPEGPPDDGPEQYATDFDAAAAIAECRTQYAAVADQLNKIIDIEQERTRRRSD